MIEFAAYAIHFFFVGEHVGNGAHARLKQGEKTDQQIERPKLEVLLCVLLVLFRQVEGHYPTPQGDENKQSRHTSPAPNHHVIINRTKYNYKTEELRSLWT